jgi:uncharacterized protein YndB with AHSA1/START domain
MSDPSVHIDVHLNAPVERVWRAWIEPAMILQWFGSDPEGSGVAANLDVRPGGSYEITFRNGDGTEYTCFGEYEKVDDRKTLSFTWSWINEPGQISRVTVRLAPDAGGTAMGFTHAGVWAESSHDYEDGWRRTFGKLERALAS